MKTEKNIEFLNGLLKGPISGPKDGGRRIEGMMTWGESFPFIYAIVLNYNGRQVNGRGLCSLLGQDYPNLRVLFVDNGSIDTSLAEVTASFGESIEYLCSPDNLYFAAGNSLGIRHALQADASYVFVLNNDTELERQCVSELVSFMGENPETEDCQPLVYAMEQHKPNNYASSSVASAGIKVSISGCCRDAGMGLTEGDFPRHPAEVGGITGGKMFLSTSTLRDAGGFDENHVMCFEDADLSFRIREKGLPLYLVPSAYMGHIRAATTSQFVLLLRIRLCETNSYRLILSHFPCEYRTRPLVASMSFTLASCALYLLRGRPSAARRSFREAGAA